ncbi:MAG: hypothetical protein IJZ85_09230 [Lachnospiraceae bacterium]|nr:hypothetical protein [Lachnospiraceae bacterium]
MEDNVRKNWREGRIARAKQIIEHWDDILRIAEEALSAAEIEDIPVRATFVIRILALVDCKTSFLWN